MNELTNREQVVWRRAVEARMDDGRSAEDAIAYANKIAQAFRERFNAPAESPERLYTWSDATNGVVLYREDGLPMGRVVKVLRYQWEASVFVLGSGYKSIGLYSDEEAAKQAVEKETVV